jgi:hypothetical protein
MKKVEITEDYQAKRYIPLELALRSSNKIFAGTPKKLGETAVVMMVSAPLLLMTMMLSVVMVVASLEVLLLPVVLLIKIVMEAM